MPARRLVYFHNHGDPGPGIYLPESWHLNRAFFKERGETVSEAELIYSLDPLLEEGLYRVEESFNCCEKNCRSYDQGLLVQLGYNGRAEPILFVPEWTELGLAFPEIGQVVSDSCLDKLTPLLVKEAEDWNPPQEMH